MRTCGSRAFVACLALAAIAVQGCSLQHDPAKTVELEISGISSESDRDAVKERLGDMTDGGGHMMSSTYFGSALNVKLSPVSDVDAFVKKINFGDVTSVEGRKIKVKFTKAPGMEF